MTSQKSIPGSHSQTLSNRMQVTCGHLQSTYKRFWEYPNVRALLPPFLVLMHQIVRASVPLMTRARDLARERSAADQVCRALDGYLAVHIGEELHHDDWLFDDLEAIGIRRSDVLSHIPPPDVASLVGSQYYWIQHHHPIALMGYMRLLEGNAPSEAHVDRLQNTSGLPPDFFRTYRFHGVNDPTHRQEMDAFLDALPLSPDQELLIWVSASHTAALLAECLTRVETQVERASLRSCNDSEEMP